MYTEEKPRRGGLLKEFIMKLILIIIFVLLLLWLVPWPNMDEINPLKDQIFNANIQTMKEAGISYFTSERLPVNVGDKTTLSLQKMLDMKLLVPFTDRNGNSCDVTKSYVSLEKKETEYLMKVNLKCGDEEDYILVHLGCYSYCTSAICEAKPNNTEKPSTTPKVTTKPTVTPTTTPTVKPTATPTVKPVTYTCKIVNGQYWGKDSKVVDQETYNSECVKPTVTPTPVADKEYQYKKETSTYVDATYSNWSDWTNYVWPADANFSLSSNEYKQMEDLGYVKEKTGYEEVTKSVVVLVPYQSQVGTKTYSVCSEREYVIEYTTTETETIYEVVGGGSGSFAATDNYYSGFNPPTTTPTSLWVPTGVNFNKCEDCVNHPYVVYRNYTRSGSAVSTESVKTTTEGSTIVSEGCSAYVTREIPVYINRVRAETKTYTSTQDVYKWVHYYRVRTRSLLEAARTDINVDYKWSNYNDTVLINSGYTYTGKTRTK